MRRFAAEVSLQDNTRVVRPLADTVFEVVHFPSFGAGPAPSIETSLQYDAVRPAKVLSYRQCVAGSQHLMACTTHPAQDLPPQRQFDKNERLRFPLSRKTVVARGV